MNVKPERELSEAAGSRDHQGVVAWCEPYPYADALGARVAASDRCSPASTRSPTRRTSARSCGAPRARGDGRRPARARRGTRDPRRVPCLRRRGRARARRGRAEPRALPRGREGDDLWSYAAVRGGSPCGTPISRAASRSSSAPREGRAAARAPHVRRRRLDPARRRRGVAQRFRRGAVLLYEARRQRAAVRLNWRRRDARELVAASSAPLLNRCSSWLSRRCTCSTGRTCSTRRSSPTATSSSTSSRASSRGVRAGSSSSTATERIGSSGLARALAPHADDLLERLAAEHRDREAVLSSPRIPRYGDGGTSGRKRGSRAFLGELAAGHHEDHEPEAAGGSATGSTRDARGSKSGAPTATKPGSRSREVDRGRRPRLGLLRGGSARPTARARGGAATRASVGRYQFHWPSSFIVAGSRTARTIVASMRIAAARPIPISFMSMIGISREDAEHEHHHDAALVTTPAVDLIPSRPRARCRGRGRSTRGPGSG